MTKRDISRILRQARDLMNKGGKHWAQHDLVIRGAETSFCSIGAINRATRRANGIRAYELDDRNRTAIYALANEIRATLGKQPLAMFTPSNDRIVMDEIAFFNDDPGRVWADIRGVFTRAAKNPVVPKP